MATSKRKVGAEERHGDATPDGRGFTLLEVMVAMAILAISFTALLGTQSQAMIITHYVRDVTVASMLARSKMADLEHHHRKEGFDSFDEEDDGDFGDEGYPKFSWHVLLEKIEADESAIESLMSQAPGSAEEISASLMDNPAFAGADLSGMNFNPSMIFAGLPMFLDQLGEKVRKVTLTIRWPEGRKGSRSMAVNTYFVLFEEVQPQVDSETIDAAVDAISSAIGDATSKSRKSSSSSTSKSSAEK